MVRYLIFYVTCLSAVVLGGCQGYDLTFNDRVVYTPPTLFDDFEVPDEALRVCLGQAIAEANITSADQLTSLNCSTAGIGDLQGLGVFTALTRLNLPSNRIRNLVELGRLTQLQALSLAENQVVDATPLAALTQLRQLDLRDNPSLQCPKTGQLQHVSSVHLPTHCTPTTPRP